MLGNRLRALANQIPRDTTLADIGTDHGLIPVYLIKEGLISKAIATDISEISLSKAKDLIRNEGLEEAIETRLGSGLQIIRSGEVNTLLIAGMGGRQIKKILEEGSEVLESITTLILQPMRGKDDLRRWIVYNNYIIDNEILVKEAKYLYQIIVASHGTQEVSDDIQFEIGFKLLENNDPLFKEFIEEKILRTSKIIDELADKDISNPERTLRALTRRLEKYKEAWRVCVQ